MFNLKITAKKIMGVCTADPPVKPGEFFTVSDGDIQVPAGGSICLWAFQSLVPLITPKEREIAEDRGEDWMWRVHHAQCPDPKGRVIFNIEQTGRADKAAGEPDVATGIGIPKSENNMFKALRVEVESVNGHCTSRMKQGDYFILRSGRIYIPAGRWFCLYALQAALPLLPAKQRTLDQGDWLKDESLVLCPDPAGNVILRIVTLE